MYYGGTEMDITNRTNKILKAICSSIATGVFALILVACEPPVQPAPGPQAPGQVTGLTATPGNARVTLSWTTVAGATSYRVYRGTTAGTRTALTSAGGTPADPTTTSFTDTGLTNGTAYFYTVSAINAGGEGMQSTEASATAVRRTTPAVTITPTTFTLAEGARRMYSLVLTTQPTGTVTVTPTSDNAAVTVPGATLSFTTGDWATEQMIEVTAEQDGNSIDETVMITNAIGGADTVYDALPDIVVTVTTDDDEAPAVMITPTTFTLAEGARRMYSVELTTQPTGTVTVTPTSDNAAVTVPGATLSFTTEDWATGQMIEVTAAQDGNNVDETVMITNAIGGADTVYDALPDIVVTVTTDDDEAGVTIAPTTFTLAEGARRMYSVMLTSRPTDTVTVTPTSDNAAVTVPGATLRFTPEDWATGQMIEVTAVQDGNGIDERVMITNAIGGADTVYDALTDIVVTVTTDDDEAGVMITPTTLTLAEGARRMYSVELTSRPIDTVTVTPTSNNAAVTVPGATLRFTTEDWATGQMIEVSAEQDGNGIDETVMITNAIGGADTVYDALPDIVVTVTTDDDEAGVMITPTTFTLAEGARRMYSVVLTSRPTDTVTVTPTSDNAAVTVPGATLRFTTGDWATAQMIEVTAAQDVNNADETAMITNAIGGADTVYDALTDIVVTVTTDDDEAGVMITPTTFTLDEGVKRMYSVELTSRPTDTVTVTPTSNNAAVTVPGTTLSFTTEDWATRQMIEVTAVQDGNGIDETVMITNAIGGADTVYDALPDIVVTVTTDDDEAGVMITPTTFTLAEGARRMYSVVLTSRPTDMVTVTPTSGNAAVTVPGATLRFTTGNWATEQMIEVTAEQDGNIIDETVMITHAIGGADTVYDALTDIVVTVTTDDDDDDDDDGVANSLDVDDDNNGLIEISNLEMLGNVRFNLAGTTYDDEVDDGTSNLGSSAGAPTSRPSNCTGRTTTTNLCGYELIANIDAWPTNDAGTRLGAITYADGSTATPAAHSTAYGTTGFVPIAGSFTGTFDGTGKTIHGLKVTSGGGLFATISGTVTNLHLRDVDIDGTGDIGALASQLTGTGVVTAVSMSGTVTGGAATTEDATGGLLGVNAGTVQNSYATGGVTGGSGGNDFAGGLVGANEGTVRNSYATGNVNGTDSNNERIGGLVGSLNSGTVRNCYATGNVNGQNGTDDVGGLIGIAAEDTTVENSYRSGTVENGFASGEGISITSIGLADLRALTTFTAPSWPTANWDFGTTSQLPAVKSGGVLVAGQR